MTSRQEAAMETRRNMIETGDRLIRERGSFNFSVDDVVKACGIARGTFYIYFKNKADLVQTISRQYFEDVGSAVATMEGPVLERLRFYIMGFIDGMERNGPHIAQLWVAYTVNPDTVPEGVDGGKPDYDVASLRELLESMVSSRDLAPDTPVGDIARMVIYQLYGALFFWCYSNGELDTRAHMDAYIRAQLEPMMSRYIL